MKIRKGCWLPAVAVVGLAACDGKLLPVEDPAPPVNLEGGYYNRGVDLRWEMHDEWDGESFRVYGKENAHSEYFFIAEVTSCAAGRCVYRDINVASKTTYEYYVAAVDPENGAETASPQAVEVYVPSPDPPPAPTALEAVALDGAAYLHWPDDGAVAEDFAVYRVYLVESRETYLLGESDSPEFLDAHAENGTTYEYFVTSVDDFGHESVNSPPVSVTPRPDYTGELVYAYDDVPSSSGFRFQESDRTQAIMHGNDFARHFRIFVEDDRLWFDPGPRVGIHKTSRATSALTCGPGSDPDCTYWDEAPTDGYLDEAVRLEAGHTHMFHVPGDDGKMRYGAVRVSHVNTSADDRFAIFDWAYQTQAGNPRLAPPPAGDHLEVSLVRD